MALSAEDQGRLLISIEATQAKFAKQLAAIAKQAGATARGIEDDFAKANGRAGTSFDKAGQSAARGLGQARAAGQQLSFQLNDIATQLASGSSPFTIMAQQGGQVAQIINGTGGVRGALNALGGAITGLLNPAGLLSVALIGAVGYATQYFAEWATSGKETTEEIEKHERTVQEVANRYKDSLPALKAYADEIARIRSEREKMDVLKSVVTQTQSSVQSQAAPAIDTVTTSLSAFGFDRASIDELQSAWDDLNAKLQEGKASSSDVLDIEKRLYDYLRTAPPEAAEGVATVADQFTAFRAEMEKITGVQAEFEAQQNRVSLSMDQVKDLTALLASEMAGMGGSGVDAFKDIAAAVSKDLLPGLHDAVAAIKDMKTDYDALQKALAQTPLGTLSPLVSGGGKIMNPAEYQDYKANNTLSQFQQELGAASGAIDGFVDRVIKVESGGRADAKNPNSSATGVGQFIDSTWLALFRKYYPERAANMGRDAILELRKDAATSAVLIRKYAEENARVLQTAGVHVDEAALQLAHFLGAGDAAKVLKAAPGTPLAGLISQSSINANPSILGGGRTVDDALAYARRRASDTGVSTPKADPTNFADAIAKTKEQIELFKVEAGASRDAAAGMNDYGFAVAKAKKEQELLNAAKQEGREITPKLREEISGLAADYANAATAGSKLAASQKATAAAAENAAKMQQQWADLASTAIQGIASALQDGKITAEEWLQIGLQIIQQLLQMQSIGGAGGAAGGGGAGGFLGLLGKLLGFADGGYTGPGAVRQPAGVVHRGEVVWSQADIRRAGGVSTVEAMRRGLRGYDAGGIVGLRAPSIPSRMGGNDMVTVHLRDDSGRMAEIADQQIQTRSGTIVRVAVEHSAKTIRRQMPGLMAEAQTRHL